jgi:MFS family permease
MLKQNIKIYKLLSVFGFSFFWQPVLFLFLTQTKGLLPSQALWLVSLYSLGVVILEVPGGAVADHYSRKLSAGLGYTLKGLGFFSLTLFTHTYGLIASMFIISLGESLTSGSLESLMYDSIKQSKELTSKYFKQVFAKTRVILHFSLAIFIALGGYIGQYNLTLPLQLSVIGYLIAALLTTKLIEPTKVFTNRGYLQHILGAAKIIFSRDGYQKGIVQLLIADFFALGLISSLFWLTTPLLSSLGIKIFWIGILTASMRLLKSLGAYLVTKFDDKNDLRSMIVTGLIMALLLGIGGVWHITPVVVFAIFTVYLIQAFYQANDIQLLNDKVGDLDRTTINSFQSMFTRLYEFSILPILGSFYDAGKPNLAMIMMSTLLVIGTVILFLTKPKLMVPTSV